MVITEFQNRKAPLGTKLEMTWEDLTTRLKKVEITPEPMEEYAASTNEQRTDIKDVGGYVAGEFKYNRRSKNNLISRYVLNREIRPAKKSIR